MSENLSYTRSEEQKAVLQYVEEALKMEANPQIQLGDGYAMLSGGIFFGLDDLSPISSTVAKDWEEDRQADIAQQMTLENEKQESEDFNKINREILESDNISTEIHSWEKEKNRISEEKVEVILQFVELAHTYAAMEGESGFDFGQHSRIQSEETWQPSEGRLLDGQTDMRSTLYRYSNSQEMPMEELVEEQQISFQSSESAISQATIPRTYPENQMRNTHKKVFAFAEVIFFSIYQEKYPENKKKIDTSRFFRILDLAQEKGNFAAFMKLFCAKAEDVIEEEKNRKKHESDPKKNRYIGYKIMYFERASKLIKIYLNNRPRAVNIYIPRRKDVRNL